MDDPCCEKGKVKENMNEQKSIFRKLKRLSLVEKGPENKPLATNTRHSKRDAVGFNTAVVPIDKLVFHNSLLSNFEVPILTANDTSMDYLQCDCLEEALKNNSRMTKENTVSGISSFHTFLYLSQMHAENSRISDSTTRLSDHDTTYNTSFNFENLQYDKENMITSSPNINLILNKSSIPKGLAIGTSSTKNIVKGTYFANSASGSPVSPTYQCKSSLLFYDPSHKSEVIKSNRLTLGKINGSQRNSMNDSLPLTLLKLHNRSQNHFGDCTKFNPPYQDLKLSKNERCHQKIQLRAQMDSRSHIDLVQSLNGLPELEDIDTDFSEGEEYGDEDQSMLEGLSAAEVHDYQKVVMWANY